MVGMTRVDKKIHPIIEYFHTKKNNKSAPELLISHPIV